MYSAYLRYLLRHKYFVWYAGRRLGVSWWQLLIHDWSKFTRLEFSAYALKFYGPKRPRRGGLGRWRRYVDRRFLRAWQHHILRNPHHWQHWVCVGEGGKLTCIPMPDRYVREMVADWFGAQRVVQGNWDTQAWYTGRREKLLLHPVTRHRVEQLLTLWSQLG